MPSVDAILTAFRAELITAALVRRPSDAGPQSSAGGAPPMHISPIDGPPGPGEREGIEDDAELVLALIDGGDLGEATGYDVAVRRRTVVDVRFRAINSAARRRAMALEAAITTRLISPATNYGYGFMLGALWCQELGVWAGYSPIYSSKATGFDDVAKYMIETPRG